MKANTYKILSYLLILTLSSFSFCKKKENDFIKFENEMVILPIKSIRPEIYNSAKSGESLGSVFSNDILKTDGLLLIYSEKEKINHSFFRILCPIHWKCQNGFGLLRRDSLFLKDTNKFGNNISRENPALIINPLDYTTFAESRTFLLNPYKSPFPRKGINLELLEFSIITEPNSYHNEALVMQLYYLYSIIINKNIDKKDNAVNYWAKDTNTLKKILSMDSEINLNEFLIREKFELDIKTYEELQKKAHAIFEKELYTLFHILFEPVEIAEFFNLLGKYPYLKEKALKHMLDSIPFLITSSSEYATISNRIDEQKNQKMWKIDSKYLNILKQIDINGQTKNYEILSIKAIADGDKLGFEVTLNDNETRLLTSEYILDIFDGKKRMEKLIHDLPSIQEIVFNNKGNPRKAAMLAALKHGKGNYNKSNNKFEYTLENEYVIFLLLKNNLVINAKETDFKGSLDYNVSVFQGNPQSITGWYQTFDKSTKERSFYLNFKEMDCGCYECNYINHNDELCYQSGYEFRISFPVTSIFLEESDYIDISSKDVYNKHCFSIFGIIN